MAINQRRILGDSADNGLKTATYVDGGNPASTGRTDQTSPETADRASATVAAFRDAQNLASGFTGSGATGEQVGRGPDTARLGQADASEFGTTTSAPGPLVTRAAGADDGASGVGKAIG